MGARQIQLLTKKHNNNYYEIVIIALLWRVRESTEKWPEYFEFSEKKKKKSYHFFVNALFLGISCEMILWTQMLSMLKDFACIIRYVVVKRHNYTVYSPTLTNCGIRSFSVCTHTLWNSQPCYWKLLWTHLHFSVILRLTIYFGSVL